ncbi:hypothetical protein VNI00_013992 [Paramarasmius palmivorus]|uniref:F-box domain-containing protein n=1 Tax=Paramarasmius palmivorus TaxID=297713 RepID=A0AAW0BWG2_9AGAR
MAKKSLRIEEKQEAEGRTSKSKTKTGTTSTQDGTSKTLAGSKRKATSHEGTRASKTRRSTKKEVQEPTRRVRGKRGMLERIVKDTPMDVVIEIFKSLLPLDILHLARTCKFLRSMLMSKSSIPIWRAARENVPGLPPPPLDLNEAQYASLAFDPHCHVCMRSPCDNVIWECRIRCHKSCESRVFYSMDELTKLKSWTKDVGVMMRKMYHEIPRYDRKYIPSTIKALRIEYMEVKDDPSSFEAWRSTKVKAARDLASHSHRCRDWNINWTRARMDELGNLRRDRRIELTRRMTALGWEGKDLGRDFADHHLVDQPKPLTERSWNIIKPTLIEFLEEQKARRLAAERQRICIERYQLVQRIHTIHCQRSPRTVFPPIGDFILAADHTERLIRAPYEDGPSESDFIKVFCAEMPKIADEWLVKKEKEVRKRVPENEVPIFRCTECSEILWAPRLFVHSCCTDSDVNPTVPASVEKRRERELNPFNTFSWRPWSSRCIVHDPQAAECVKMMFELSGAHDLDELDRLDPLFECLDCGFEARQFLRWTKVLQHPIKHTFSITSFDEDLKKRILNLNQYPHPGTFSRYQKYLSCKLCDDSPITTSIQIHMQEKHDIAESDICLDHWGWSLNTPIQFLHPHPVRLIGGELS